MPIDPRFIKTVGIEQVELLQSIDAHLKSLNTNVGEKLLKLDERLERIETFVKKVLSDSEGGK
jgi:hypothetical protein